MCVIHFTVLSNVDFYCHLTFYITVLNCSRTPCLLWHRISPSVHVKLKRFCCVSYVTVQLTFFFGVTDTIPVLVWWWRPQRRSKRGGSYSCPPWRCWPVRPPASSSSCGSSRSSSSSGTRPRSRSNGQPGGEVSRNRPEFSLESIDWCIDWLVVYTILVVIYPYYVVLVW